MQFLAITEGVLRDGVQKRGNKLVQFMRVAAVFQAVGAQGEGDHQQSVLSFAVHFRKLIILKIEFINWKTKFLN